MRVAITDPAINKAKRDAAADGARRELADTTERGLRLRITAAGSATWVLGCRDQQGRARRFVLGNWPALGLREAREAARALRQDVRVKGSDPIAAGRSKRAAAKDAAAGIGTLTALLDHYETIHGQQLRSWADCRRQITNVFRQHMDRPIQSLTRMDLQGAADKHAAKQAAAAAVRYVRPVLRWAAKRDMVDADIIELDPPAKVQQRERVLSDKELAAIWRATDAPGIPATFGRLVRLLMLTGQRREEVAAMRWDELSADRETWTLPSSRMKNHTAHVVPLSEAAQNLLPDTAGDGLVFPGQRHTPFAGWSKAKAALDTASGVKGWRIHDIRRTVATGLQRLGVRLEVTEAVLGHVSGSRAGIVGVYQRHTWAEEKKAALAAWAAHLAAVVEGRNAASNVLPLSARTAA